MSKTAKRIELNAYRKNVAKEFLAKCNRVGLLNNEAYTNDIVRLYRVTHDLVYSAIKDWRTASLAKVIESTPSPVGGISPLLSLRKTEHGLEALNFLGLSGRDYLEELAHCAIVCAIFDYIKEQRIYLSPANYI